MSGPSLVAAGVTLGLTAFITACRDARPAGGRDAGPITVTEIGGGSHSGILEPRVWIARTPEEWADLWAAHSSSAIPARPAPDVDFDSEMVIGVFLGQRPSSGYGVEVRSCHAENGRVRVRVRETQPDPDTLQATVVTSPFRLVRVPRAEGEAVLEFVESTSD